MSKITLGADPEFFIQPSARETDDPLEDSKARIVPICGLIGGTKSAPKPLEKLGSGFFVQEDGIACEFNIPPVEDCRSFRDNTLKAVQALFNDLRPKGYTTSTIRSVELKDEWTTKRPELLQIGCDPDYCAYDEAEGSRTLDMAKIRNIRGVGGHIHLGYNTQMIRPKVLARLLDCVLAIPTLEDDRQGERRQWWGEAGIYRPKEYGIEYRTLSNFWIWEGGKSLSIGAHCIALLEGIQKNMVQWQAFYYSVNWESVRNTIRTENLTAARSLYAAFRRHPCFDAMTQRAGHLQYSKQDGVTLAQQVYAAPQFGVANHG